MATALAEEDLMTCRVCLERFKEPRKLPCCEHSFCEDCILRHLSSLEKSKKDEHAEFTCPLCRSVIKPPPQDFIVTREWVQTFQKNMELLAELEIDTNKVKDKEDMCNLCKELGQISKSKSFCVECQEHLCASCTNIHRVSKLSKHHNIVDTATNVKKGENDAELLIMMSKYMACSEHRDKPVEFYCEDDDVLFCVTCYISYHRKCNSVLDINEHVSKNSVREESVCLKESFVKLSEFSQATIHAHKEHGACEQRQTEALDARLQDIHTQVNRLLENTEENVRCQYKSNLKQTHFHVSDITDNLSGIRNQLEGTLALIEKVLAIGSESQMYIALHKLKQDFQHHENRVLELCGSYKANNFQVVESDLLSRLLSISINETDTLVKIEAIETDVDFPRYNGRRVHNFFAIEKIETKPIKENYDAPYGPMYSCLLYVSNNYFMLIDNRFGHCCLTNANFDVIASCNFMPNMKKEVDFKRMPFSAANLQDGVIAVSVPEEKKIYLVSVESEHMLKTAHVATKYKPKALYGLHNGDIAVAWDDPVAFGIISPQQISQWLFPERSTAFEKVYFTEDKNGRQLSQFDYMAVDETRSHVVQSCRKDSAVYVFDFKGNPKFCYKNSDLMRPQGVATDTRGNIYVCEEKNSSIHIISPTGVSVSIVKDGCPSEPLAIGLNGEQFAVSHSGLGYAGRDITFYRIVKK